MADLITIDDYKLAVGITGVKDDDKINVLIPAISQLVKNYCDNSIIDNYSSAYTEYFDIQWNTYTAQLKYSPIVNIVEVSERTTLGDSYIALAEGVDYWFDNVSDSVFRVDSSGRYYNWPKGVGAVKISYTCGYDATPADLKLAVVDLITYYLKDERKERRTIGGASIAYAPNSDDGSFPDYIKRVLDMYKI